MQVRPKKLQITADSGRSVVYFSNLKGFKSPTVIFSDTVNRNINSFCVKALLGQGSKIIESDVLLDTGSDICIIGRSRLALFRAVQIAKYTETILGIEGRPVQSKGIVKLDLQLGNCFFPSVCFNVVDHDNIPIIIGKALFSSRCTDLQFDFKQNQVNFICDKDGERKHGFADFSLDNRKLNATYVADSIGHIKNQLLSVYNIDLSPSEHSPEEIDKIARLLYKHRDAFSCDDCVIGLFETPARIPTVPGKQMQQAQHPVAKRHQPLVDVEIEKMLEQGVIEHCSDPKGWNSPIFIVDKADGSPRVVVNFKRTLNPLLIEEDTFQQDPSTRALASKVFSKESLNKG